MFDATKEENAETEQKAKLMSHNCVIGKVNIHVVKLPSIDPSGLETPDNINPCL